jgi:hypothetical protein
MFKNRSVVMKVIDDKNINPDAAPVEPIDPNEIIQNVTKSVIMIIGFYIAADTVRQLIIK